MGARRVLHASVFNVGIIQRDPKVDAALVHRRIVISLILMPGRDIPNMGRLENHVFAHDRRRIALEISLRDRARAPNGIKITKLRRVVGRLKDLLKLESTLRRATCQIELFAVVLPDPGAEQSIKDRSDRMKFVGGKKRGNRNKSLVTQGLALFLGQCRIAVHRVLRLFGLQNACIADCGHVSVRNAQVEDFEHLAYRSEFAAGATDLAELPAIGRAWQNEAIAGGLPEHSHPGAFEFVVVTKGRLLWWVEEEELDLAVGQLFCTKPDERHGAIGAALEPSEIMWIQVRLDSSGAFGLPDKDRQPLAFGLADALRTAPSSPIHAHHLRCILDAYERGSARPAFIRAHVICFLAASLDGLTKHKSEALDSRIAQAMRLMSADRHARLSLPMIAERIGLSESWFYVLFQRSTGLAPAVWLRETRIDEAKGLLKQTDRPITQIAHDLGFASSQYFATVFRKRTGQTPRGYRISMRNLLKRHS